MVLRLSRRQIAPRSDPHDWNSWDHYRSIHELRLTQHPFVVSDTLVFRQEGEGIIQQSGSVQCHKKVILEVEKWFEARRFGQTLRVRCYSYAYIAWIAGQHLLLKYHNLHKDHDEYHHRLYDPTTGTEVFHETLQRWQFPTFPEVLDELEFLTQDL